MRELNTIQKNYNLNEVYAVDEKGPGGANHRYLVQRTRYPVGEPTTRYDLLTIQFQKGARYEERSKDGVIDSDLLEIVRDRLKYFQEGDFACEYNAKALEHVELALMYLNRRVEDRIERNVIGTYNK